MDTQLSAMTADEIRRMVMARRTGAGLKLVLVTPEGNETTLYPKDQATKARWLASAQAKGMTVVIS